VTQDAKVPREDAKTPLLATEGFKAPSLFYDLRRQGSKSFDIHHDTLSLGVFVSLLVTLINLAP
jgi:hypothetical protein